MRSLPVQEPRQPGRVGIGHGATQYLSAYHEEGSTLSCWWCLCQCAHALYACAGRCWSGAALQPGSQAQNCKSVCARLACATGCLAIWKGICARLVIKMLQIMWVMMAPHLANSPAALSASVWQNTRCICSAGHCQQYFAVLVQPRRRCERSVQTVSTWLRIAATQVVVYRVLQTCCVCSKRKQPTCPI